MIPPAHPGGDCRFPKSARLAQSFEFACVKQKGRSWPGRYLVMGVYRSGAEKAARIGLITSRRVGNAVLRNRVRRRLREIVRVERSRLQPGLWIVLVAQGGGREGGPGDAPGGIFGARNSRGYLQDQRNA